MSISWPRCSLHQLSSFSWRRSRLSSSARFCDERSLTIFPRLSCWHVSAVTALFGWGRLTFERWGSALVVALRDKPELDEDELGAAALLGGMFSEISQRQVSCVPAGDSKFIMVDFEVAETVWGWFKDGTDLPTIVGMLETKRAS